LYDDAQSDDDDDDSADILEAILGYVGQREDVGYDDDGVDISVGEWSRCQARCRSRCLSSFSSPLLISLDS